MNLDSEKVFIYFFVQTFIFSLKSSNISENKIEGFNIHKRRSSKHAGQTNSHSMRLKTVRINMVNINRLIIRFFIARKSFTSASLRTLNYKYQLKSDMVKMKWYLNSFLYDNHFSVMTVPRGNCKSLFKTELSKRLIFHFPELQSVLSCTEITVIIC